LPLPDPLDEEDVELAPEEAPELLDVDPDEDDEDDEVDDPGEPDDPLVPPSESLMSPELVPPKPPPGDPPPPKTPEEAAPPPPPSPIPIEGVLLAHCHATRERITKPECPRTLMKILRT
jgi:hypothetical protein